MFWAETRHDGGRQTWLDVRLNVRPPGWRPLSLPKQVRNQDSAQGTGTGLFPSAVAQFEVNSGLIRFLPAFVPRPAFFRTSHRLNFGYASSPMEPHDRDNAGDPTCNKCGQPLKLVGSLPKIGDESRVRLYKCVYCQLVIRIPPLD
jgi:hypothetical protein